MNNEKGISGSTLKLIALVSMLIDHIAASGIDTWLRCSRALITTEEAYSRWYAVALPVYRIDLAMRLVGRIAFPIYIFLLVEGVMHTRNLRRYAGNLFLFALISEIPFDLAFDGRLVSWSSQNVFFTLLLGVLTICAMKVFLGVDVQKIKPMLSVLLFVLTGAAAGAVAVWLLQDGPLERVLESLPVCMPYGALAGAVIAAGWSFALSESRRFRLIQVVLPICVGVASAQLLRTDYGGWGVLAIAIAWILREKPVSAAACDCAVLCLSTSYELTAWLALLPISRYNGTRGLKLKYFFYAFYPGHLFLLYLATVLLGFQSFASAI